VGVQVLAGVGLDLRRVPRAALVAARCDNAVEHVLGAVLQPHHQPGPARLDRRHPAVEADAAHQVEMRGVVLEVALHLGMVGIQRGVRGEREVAIGADPRLRVDAQRTVGRAEPVVVLVDPQAADLRPGLENCHVEAAGNEGLGGAKPAGPGPDDGEPLLHPCLLALLGHMSPIRQAVFCRAPGSASSLVAVSGTLPPASDTLEFFYTCIATDKCVLVIAR